MEEAPKLVRQLTRSRGRAAAEDVVQAAFERLMGARLEEIERPRAFLARIALNLAADEARRDGRTPVRCAPAEEIAALEEKLAALGASAEDDLIDRERRAVVAGVLHSLPRKERLALLWAKLEGLTHRQIGKRLGEPHTNVPFYLSRALAKCRKALHAFDNCDTHGFQNDGRGADAD
ncbi:MAG: sigma-70 family RNA polymerase sigma factor [Hyphomonadaceae bacterium JAD_PAG50586_4]|nr:MAG: sigma-70 family RNA polymerase sigma factor [Hyphomonadaceae bacterium JAD_PAG50586_4]